MRIQGPYVPAAVERPGRASGVDSPKAAEHSPDVQLAASVQALSGLMHKGGAARAERIARLKDQVAAGTYKVDAGRVADQLADEEWSRAGLQ
jgi:flagellar biosynthesis anti-sigma factor FlgM